MKNFTNAEDYRQHYYFYPVLKVMQDYEGSSILYGKDIVDMVIEYLDIPESELENRIKNGKSRIKSRIQFVISYLYHGEYLERPARAHYRLTEKGRDIKSQEELNEFWKELDREYDKNYVHPSKRKQEEVIAETNTDIEILEEEVIDNWRAELLSRLMSLEPIQFEKFCVDVLATTGISDLKHTGKSNDKGIDAEGYMVADNFITYKLAFQFKRYTEGNRVSSGDIREFLGSLSMGNAYDKGIFITTSEYTKEAKADARKLGTKITLIDGDGLCDLVKKSEVFTEVEMIEKVSIKYKEIDRYKS